MARLLNLETFHFCGSKAAQGGGQRTARPAGGSPVTSGSEAPLADGLEDDDIPF